jgi:hypothetical protein
MKKYILLPLLAFTNCFQANAAQGIYAEGFESSRFTKLHLAAQNGDLERVRALLADSRFSIDALDDSKNKPLYYAQESLERAKRDLARMEQDLANSAGKSEGFITSTKNDREKYAQQVTNLTEIINLLK